MKMWVSDHPWKDILARIEKLWSSSRGKRHHETVLEVNKEADEVLGDRKDEKEPRKDVNVVHNGSSLPILHAKGRGGWQKLQKRLRLPQLFSLHPAQDIRK